jgi:hypothetical protein
MFDDAQLVFMADRPELRHTGTDQLASGAGL